ncbi:tryptophan-rich sensory protein [Proteocatella sphenisci]|uniref:tryptophan-rich sensory protein n=1 Tax=Proteocatella sphenisci TaxID=181070 RepID=UPI0004AEFF7A|nr:tryptophan-rich sensory protein [Proteocatella sphenisci]
MSNYKNKYLKIKITTTVSYIIMIAVNFLANSIPINGVKTSEVSDAYKNLFTPAGFTFSIWGIIYLLLALHLLYEFEFLKKFSEKVNIRLVNKVALPFSISSIANAGWIISWHYNYIGVSVVFMIVILISLYYINKEISKRNLNSKQKFFIRIPFGIYFGWITVATIANITVFLVSIGWSGFGISDVIWTNLVLIIGTIIGSLVLLKFRNIEYGLVLIWSYFGIYVRHTSSSGFYSEYQGIIYTVLFCIALLIFNIIYILLKSKNN